MVGVQALIWYRDLHVEVSIIFVLDSIAVSQFRNIQNDHLDCARQVLGLTVRVLEDLPLLLNPLAILTLRSIIFSIW